MHGFIFKAKSSFKDIPGYNVVLRMLVGMAARVRS
jgi:hypothetical protein